MTADPSVVRAHLADLVRASQSAERAYAETDGRRRQIDGHVTAMRTSWTGPAATSFLAKWEEIDDECVEMLADLRFIGDALSSSVKLYAEMEADHVQQLASIPSGNL